MIRRGMDILTIVLATAAITGVFLRGSAGAPAQSSDSVELRGGRMFPTTVFPSLEDGRPGSVADFRGKKVILHIFASW